MSHSFPDYPIFLLETDVYIYLLNQKHHVHITLYALYRIMYDKFQNADINFPFGRNLSPNLLRRSSLQSKDGQILSRRV